MTCPRCATPAPAEAICCPRCEYLLTAPPPPDPAAPALAVPRSPGSPAAVPPRAVSRSGGSTKKPWGWWGAGLAAAVLLGTALGWDVYLGQVQQIGAAWQQLNADAKAIRDHQSSTPSTTAPPADLPAPVASQLAGYRNIITGTVPPVGTVAFPVTLIGPAGRVQTTAMVDTGNELPPILVERLAQQIGLTPTGATAFIGVVPGVPTTGPTYGAFDVVPQGQYVAGSPSALHIAQAVGVTQSTSGVGINLGQTVLAHTKLVEQDGRWWFAWNGTPAAPQTQTPTTPRAQPPTTPRTVQRPSMPPAAPPTPPPTQAPRDTHPSSSWTTVTVALAGGRRFTIQVPPSWTAVDRFPGAPPGTVIAVGQPQGIGPDGEPLVVYSVVFQVVQGAAAGPPGPIPGSIWLTPQTGQDTVYQSVLVPSPTGAWTRVTVCLPPSAVGLFPRFWQSLRVLS